MADDDQTMPQEQPAPTSTPKAKTQTAPAVAPKRKRRAKKKQAKAAAAPAPVKRTKSSSGVVSVPKSVVYGLLIALVIASTFALGYYASKAGLFDGNGANNGGAAKDAITIIEYSDFECPFCSRALPTLAQVKSTYGDKVEIIYKHYPLESIHPNALGAAIAAECVREIEGEDAFWTYHDTLFANQQALDTASLKSYAHAQGLGSDFDTCLDTKATEDTVREHMSEGNDRGVRGTPSFWVEDELVVGALPFDSFKAVIDRKLAGAAAPAPAAPTPAPAPAAPSAPVDVATGNNVMGDADAPVVIVEFSDFQCPFCQRFYQQTEGQIIDQYVATGKVRFAYRHFPLSFHQNAQKSAEASECAADQGKFWEYHDILFENMQGDGTGLNNADLKGYAVELGLDADDFNTCLDSGAKAALVQADFAAGSAAGVSGTPAFFVNGKAIVGAQPFSAFQAAIDAELAGN